MALRVVFADDDYLVREGVAALLGRAADVVGTAADLPGLLAAVAEHRRAVEKHINAIFTKLDIAAEPVVHRRVKAVLLFLDAG